MFEKPTVVQKHRLPLSLSPVFIGQLLILDTINHPAYCFNNDCYQVVLNADEPVTSTFVSDYAQKFGTEIYIHEQDQESLLYKVKEEITKLSRSLSIGNIQKNATKHANLLSMQMETLYSDPFNDDLLTNQYQNSKNLSALLVNNPNIHKDLFLNISRSNYHYTITQPFLSSLMLLSFLKQLGGFSDKEIQNLFLTSYFKDIGMSFIPREKFELALLSDYDRRLFASHAENSMKILDQRVPFTNTQLNLIKNHHYLNYKIQSLISGKKLNAHNEEMLTGIESALLSSIDILVAMTHDRPYRKALTSYQALELLKKVLSDEYSQEFKILVMFLKKFYSS